MAEAEAQAFRASKPPEITTSDEVPLTSNCEAIDQRIRAVHASLLGSDHIVELPTMMFSEDFSQYGLPGRPSLQWRTDSVLLLGIWRPLAGALISTFGDSFITKLAHLPSNHQPNFAPQPESTLRVGVRALTSSTLAYLPAA